MMYFNMLIKNTIKESFRYQLSSVTAKSFTLLGSEANCGLLENNMTRVLSLLNLRQFYVGEPYFCDIKYLVTTFFNTLKFSMFA